MADKQCASCKTSIKNDSEAVIFPCPKCAEELVRCGKCRKTSVRYKCLKCGFEGP